MSVLIGTRTGMLLRGRQYCQGDGATRRAVVPAACAGTTSNPVHPVPPNQASVPHAPAQYR
eukprot:3093829-Rhodomonas_salina.3